MDDLSELAVRAKTCLEARAELAGATYERLQSLAQRRTYESTMMQAADYLHEYFVRRFESDVQRFDPSGVRWTTYCQNTFVYSITDTNRRRDFHPACRYVGRVQQGKPGVAVKSVSTAQVVFAGSSRPHTIGDELSDGRRDAAEDLDRLCDLLRCCDQRERLLMLLLYVDAKTMKEAGKQIGVSESRVSQMHKEVLNRIQRRLGSRRNAA